MDGTSSNGTLEPPEPNSPSLREGQCETLVDGSPQVVSRLEGALSEVRTAQAHMQVEMSRLGQRVDVLQPLTSAACQSASGQVSEVLSNRLDSLSADLRQERHRRVAGEVLLQKAIGTLLRCAQPVLGSPEELLHDFEELRALDEKSASCERQAAASSTVATAVASSLAAFSAIGIDAGFASTVPTTLGAAPTGGEELAPELCEKFVPPQASLDAVSSVACPAREAYEELFVKKARCFEQAVNMIEVTAASVTKRLEAVVSESSAAMRREATDRAQAKAEIHRALQEIRNASDRASALPKLEPSGTLHQLRVLGRQGEGAGTPATPAMPSIPPGGDAAGGDSSLMRPMPQRMFSGGLASSGLVPGTLAMTAEAACENDGGAKLDSKLTIARCGSDSLGILSAASVKISAPALPSGSGGSIGVVRQLSHPQHMLSHDMSDLGAFVATTSDLSAIAEQHVTSQPSPRKHIVLAPKTMASSPTSYASNSGAAVSTLQAGTYGGSALFRQAQAQKSGAPPPMGSPITTSTAAEAQSPQSMFIAATPRPGSNPNAQYPHPAAASTALAGARQVAQASSLYTAQQPHGAARHVALPQQQQQLMPPGQLARPGDATPVAMRPGSVPPGMRVPGRSLATGAAVMRFTSK